MKKMNKWLALLLAAAMMLAMAACAPAATPPATPPANPGNETPPAEGGDKPGEGGTDGEKATLTMGTNAYFPPYEFYENEKIVGIDAEIAGAIAEKLGMELVIEDMEFGAILNALNTGKVDIGMAGMTVTEDRLLEVNFSDTYATGIQSIIVKDGSPIAGPDDLAGKKIGVQLSTTGDIYATGDYGEDAVERYNKGADAVIALAQGKIDAVIIDNEPAKAFVAANSGLVILETEYTLEDYAIAVAKENTELLDKVNAALGELIADGTVQGILDKYIGAE